MHQQTFEEACQELEAALPHASQVELLAKVKAAHGRRVGEMFEAANRYLEEKRAMQHAYKIEWPKPVACDQWKSMSINGPCIDCGHRSGAHN